MLVYEFADDRIFGGRLGEKSATEIAIPPELEQHWRVEEDFIAAVRSPGSIQPQPSFAEGVQYMRVVQAVADSVEQGREVNIAS
jgi:predicted dehydrogenase